MSGPLLNRRQLWLLIILLPGLILLLSLLGPMPGQSQIQAQIQASTDQRVYQRLHQDSHYQLQLLLMQRAPDTPSAWLSGQLLHAVIASRAQHPETRAWLQQQSWQLQLEARTTELIVNIHTTQPPETAQINALMKRLQEPAEIDWDALIQRQTAQHYLRMQSAQEAALAALSPGPLPATWEFEPAQLFRSQTRAEQWQLAVLTPEFLPISAPTSAMAEPGTGTAQTSTVTLLPRPLSHEQLQAYYWRWPTATRLSDILREQLALQCLRHALNSRITTGAYRLRWQAWTDGSGLSLLLNRPESSLHTWLRCPEEPEFEILKQAFVHEWTDRFQADPAAWLRLLARHQLPASEPHQLAATAALLQRSDIEHYLQLGPGSDSYRRLIFPRATEDADAPPQ